MSKSTTSVIDTAASETAISPRKLAHVVLGTKSNFDAMVKWYCFVLGAKIVFNAGHIIFLSYDNEHHRIAIAAGGDLAERPRRAVGLDHIAFTYEDIDSLLTTFARLKEVGILPYCSVNHGPTTSLYYHDPDQNRIELQVDNFADMTDATALMQEQFSINPIGAEFDPDELLARLRAGVDPAELIRPIRNTKSADQRADSKDRRLLTTQGCAAEAIPVLILITRAIKAGEIDSEVQDNDAANSK